MSDNTIDRKNAAMFMQLVLTFQTAAWQQMGKMKNPLTDKVEKDLNQARFSIDMLEMIRAKTKGNLSEPEQQIINRAVSDLQLNYVAEFDKDQKAKAEEKATEKPKEEYAEKPTGEAKESEEQEMKAEAKKKKPASKKPKKDGDKAARKK
ncbi:MAG: DUF1844 domain-containing protein [bacterium]